MDAGELKRKFGDRLAFCGGGCDAQHVLPVATPEQVAALDAAIHGSNQARLVRSDIKTFAGMIGHVMSAGDEIPGPLVIPADGNPQSSKTTHLSKWFGNLTTFVWACRIDSGIILAIGLEKPQDFLSDSSGGMDSIQPKRIALPMINTQTMIRLPEETL